MHKIILINLLLVHTEVGRWGKDLLVCNLFEIFCVNPSLEFNWDSFFNLIGLASEVYIVNPQTSKNPFFFHSDAIRLPG